MKEHPILFSNEMVKAILEGRKTQTRRMNKLDYINENPGRWKYAGIGGLEENPKHYFEISSGKHSVYCPYGKIGDQLWVRETFGTDFFGTIYYKADDLFVPVGAKAKWKPSIFMPRKASRIQLEIVNIVVERLNNISGVDCIAEGIDKELCKDYNHDNIFLDEEAAKEYYQELWEKINGKGSWEKNPWVWKIEFKRIN
ncbi:MAG: hypothetical protein M0P61_00135 [Ignavibacteriaceae bacterium]|jgi:hypothetical protein|nr:hypothetical protein [Ignavibacteriaceae bacterium]